MCHLTQNLLFPLQRTNKTFSFIMQQAGALPIFLVLWLRRPRRSMMLNNISHQLLHVCWYVMPAYFWPAFIYYYVSFYSATAILSFVKGYAGRPTTEPNHSLGFFIKNPILDCIIRPSKHHRLKNNSRLNKAKLASIIVVLHELRAEPRSPSVRGLFWDVRSVQRPELRVRMFMNMLDFIISPCKRKFKSIFLPEINLCS